MLRFPKPFYRTARGGWFVQVGGKQVNLGRDREAAFRRYHELMGRPKADTQPVAADDVLGVLDAFLDWCSKTRPAAPTTGIAATSSRSRAPCRPV